MQNCEEAKHGSTCGASVETLSSDNHDTNGVKGHNDGPHDAYDDAYEHTESGPGDMMKLGSARLDTGNTMGNLSDKEGGRIRMFRFMVGGMLVMTAVVTVTAFIFLTREENKNFETAVSAVLSGPSWLDCVLETTKFLPT